MPMRSPSRATTSCRGSDAIPAVHSLLDAALLREDGEARHVLRFVRPRFDTTPVLGRVGPFTPPPTLELIPCASFLQRSRS